MAGSTASRVQKHRANLRAKGLKLIQIWVPDTHMQGFAEECRQQSLLTKQADNDHEINEFIGHASDFRGWE